jgi:hypothetical protein
MEVANGVHAPPQSGDEGQATSSESPVKASHSSA